jgi:hypothetical protein
LEKKREGKEIITKESKTKRKVKLKTSEYVTGEQKKRWKRRKKHRQQCKVRNQKVERSKCGKIRKW